MTTIINLASLRRPLAAVDLGTAGTHQVFPMTGHAMICLQAAKDKGEASKLWEAAVLCLPTAPAAAVWALSPAEIEAVIAIASGEPAPTSE